MESEPTSPGMLRKKKRAIVVGNGKIGARGNQILSENFVSEIPRKKYSWAHCLKPTQKNASSERAKPENIGATGGF